ncbi:hypothetical protein LX32DRAFT_608962 [Colletotrichum zoysiae]|uniref:Uncharacterized protein n=1 Tax=Colletotrichum zoysiae TaxID=1216348 RepID=A0AAD9M6W3_9PEZI|nr:hypothetical protein LX32DRAFT_608962 [Colletotrichum zoysiae]
MHISSSRHRRGGAPTPIRMRRQSNSPLFAGRIPAPWSPVQPTPLSRRTTNFSPFPVSPVSMTTDCERELPPSDITPPTPRMMRYLAGYRWAEDSSSRRENVESRTGCGEMEAESIEAAEHSVAGPERVHATRLSVHREGRGHAQPISWWKYPWVVLMLVLFTLFVPSYKDIL